MSDGARAAAAIILPAGTDGGGVPSSATVAGLSVLRRLVLAAERAGFAPVLVGQLRPDEERLVAGTSAASITATPPAALPRRIVLLPSNVVPQAAWLAELRALPIQPGHLYVDDASVAVLEVEDPAEVVETVARSRGATEAVTALAKSFTAVRGALGGDGSFVLHTARDVRAAERWLLRSLIKPREGFMSRHFERRISLALTRRLIETPITPNTMTLVSLGVGLSGAPFFASSSLTWQLAGALLFLAHSILDGCDGELARLKFLESAHGAVLDFWGDNLVHAAVFIGMAVGLSHEVGAAWALTVGVAALASTGATAAVVYRSGLLFRPPTEETAPATRLVETLAHRDFIYLIVLLAAAGKAAWFIVLTAVGAPFFLLLLLWTGRAARPTPGPARP